MTQPNVYNRFSSWLDKHLSMGLPNDIVAVNFNLYEGAEQTYDVELVGFNSFDEDDPDWAAGCDEPFTTREGLFFIRRTDDIADWKQGHSFITSLVTKYLAEGKYANELKKYKAVGIGFVDCDLDIIYRAE